MYGVRAGISRSRPDGSMIYWALEIVKWDMCLPCDKRTCSQGTMITPADMITLYHGTDAQSALDILNNGLQADKLLALQARHPVQSGVAWYAACDPEVAWFFASLAPGDTAQGCTVIEMSIPLAVLERLIMAGLASRERIANVPFMAEQIRFDLATFDVLNAQAEFRPSRKA